MKKLKVVRVTIALVFSIAILAICSHFGLKDSKIIASVALLGVTLGLMNLFTDTSSKGEVN